MDSRAFSPGLYQHNPNMTDPVAIDSEIIFLKGLINTLPHDANYHNVSTSKEQSVHFLVLQIYDFSKVCS